jgi:hypothetical protein
MFMSIPLVKSDGAVRRKIESRSAIDRDAFLPAQSVDARL